MEKVIYLDNAATTKVLDGVALEVDKYLREFYGNPSSIHDFGKKSKASLEEAREGIAKVIGAKSNEIFFTSGGTESNNLAIRGIVFANPEKKHIITSVIEHPSVLEICRDLEKSGYFVDYLSVDNRGIIDIEELRKKISKKTLLVSVMSVNNEIGTVQPIKEIGEICKENGVFFHSDAVQAFMKEKIDVEQIDVDLMSFSGHKVNAPKGTGFLYIRNGINLMPLLLGGGQERGFRSGTENLPGIRGLAKAVLIERDLERTKNLRDRLVKEVLKIPGSRLNGSENRRVCNNANFSFYGIEGESLMLILSSDNIFVSTGSACASNKLEESYVLKAIGVDEMYIHGSIRITLDEQITEEDLAYVVGKINGAVLKLREISPFKLKLEGQNEENN